MNEKIIRDLDWNSPGSIRQCSGQDKRWEMSVLRQKTFLEDTVYLFSFQKCSNTSEGAI